MISYLRGQFLETVNDTVIIDVNGVGYETHCSIHTIEHVKNSKDVQLWIYTHVREDQITLFGFSNKNEKSLFISLLKVNGVGPKVALNILSGGTAENLIQMIENEDAKSLSKLPKVGKKTAEQIILTLRGKLSKIEESAEKIEGVKKQIFFALVNLGFKELDVEKVIKDFSETINFEDGLRQGLSSLTGQ